MIPKNNELRFETTTFCDYDCVICSRRNTDRRLKTMSLESFRFYFDKIIKETDQYTALSFAGTGDPLCDEGLEDKLRYALKKKPNLNIPTVTNGYRLTPDRFKSLQDAGVDIIRVSFHGGTPEAYKSTHRRDNFEKVRANVLSALDNKTTTDIVLTFVVTPENEYSIDSWLELWDDDRIFLKEIWRAHNWVGHLNYREVQKEKLTTCGRVFNGPLQVQVDGTVVMCCMDFHGKLLLGDLNTQSLHEIFESPIYKKLEACHTTGIYTDDILCKECEQRNKNKEEACIYSSKYKDIKDRVKRVSTTYARVI
jgi:wyosine [tRNA(Phe)-imidazoG37] synthetase (radical SAM superfamily)